jgi:hypothetical protein
VIGYYAHHHGNGHLTRAAAVAGRVDGMTVLTSCDPSLLPGPAVRLPLDTDLPDPPPTDVDELHFAPTGSRGLADRMAAIASWIAETRPRLMVIDVSVEVALLSRLCGVPFVYLRQTGDRSDAAHRLAYRWAAALWAPFERYQEPTSTPSWIMDKSRYSGAVTRFDGRPRPEAPDEGDRRALVVGDGIGRLGLGRADAGRWDIRRQPEDRAISLDDLAWSSVVVGPAGNNLVAETAFARRGLLCLPEDRPFSEQTARARMLRRAGAARVVLPGESGETLENLLDDAKRRAPRLAAYADGTGAPRAAGLLAGLSETACLSRPDESPPAPALRHRPI